MDILRQTAYMTVNPIVADNFVSLFNCTTAGRSSDSDGSFLSLFRCSTPDYQLLPKWKCCGNNAAVLPQYKLVARKAKLLKLQYCYNSGTNNQGPVVQSVVSLTSSLRVISLTVLADSVYNILNFFAEKMWVAFALQKLLTFFQQKFQHICVSLDLNFNESLTNDVVSFEQPGPSFWKYFIATTTLFLTITYCQNMTILATTYCQ